MARRGPPPKPDSKPTRYGTNSFYKTTATVVPGEPVEMPASIAADPAAVDFWNRHAPDLVQAGRLEQRSAEAFALACKFHSDCVRLEARLATEGDVIVGTRGFPAINPVAKHLRDCRRDLLKVQIEFGMTALGSARIPRETEPAKDNPLAAFGITG